MSKKITIILTDSNYESLLGVPSCVSISEVINKALRRYFFIREDAIKEIKLRKGVS